MPQDAGGSREARSPFAWLARVACARPGRILALGALVAVIAAVAGRGVFDVVKPFGFQDPDSESAVAAGVYEQATGTQPPPGVVALVEPDGGIETASGRALIEATVEELKQVDGITGVEGPASGRELVSPDRMLALVTASLAAEVEDPAKVGEAVQRELARLSGVSVGGPAVAAAQINEQSEEDVRRIELIVAPILLLICLWVFRGLIAALIPIVLGAFSIVLAIAAMRGLAELVDIDVFSITVITGLGLGLAIDYSLLIVSRYREELEAVGPGREAIERTLRTAGATVAFSSVTVAVALAALLIFPQRFLYSSGIGGALVALLSAAAALTVLPALLVRLGPRVNSLAIPRLRRTGSVPEGAPAEIAERGFWYRSARFAMRRPGTVALLATAALLAGSAPLLDLELTSADASVIPPDRSARQVADTVDERLAPGATTPIVVIARSSPPGSPSLAAVVPRLRAVEGVTEVRGPIPLGEQATIVEVYSAADPFSEEGQAVLRRVRAVEWPVPVLLAGRSAELADQTASLERHLPWAIVLVVALTLVALFALTRSLLLPFVALAMNLLTIGAALGIVVFIFQEGRLEGLLDYASRGAIDTSMPILIVAVAFGVSTDYGVFLLGRIRELRDRGAGLEDAVAIGLGRTGRVVTAAALLFAVAVGAFVASELVMIKQGAVGIAAAVLIDATIVRALLLPATVRLLGARAWWAPGSVARLHSRLSDAAYRVRS